VADLVEQDDEDLERIDRRCVPEEPEGEEVRREASHEVKAPAVVRAPLAGTRPAPAAFRRVHIRTTSAITHRRMPAIAESGKERSNHALLTPKTVRKKASEP
jgi:hypothetical protein